MTPAHQLTAQSIFNHCVQHMTMGAFSLGTSGAKAAEGGNLAFMEVRNKGIVLFRVHAFSNSSSLGKVLKADFAPSVPKSELGKVGIPNGQQHANHTEPKLLLEFEKKRDLLKGGFDEVILASQLDCCGSCLNHTISAITALFALMDLGSDASITFTVVEINARRVRPGHEF